MALGKGLNSLIPQIKRKIIAKIIKTMPLLDVVKLTSTHISKFNKNIIPDINIVIATINSNLFILHL